MSNAFEYAEQNHIMLEKDYPQVNISDGVCQYVEEAGYTSVKRFINVLPHNVEQLRIAVSMAPVVAAVQASHPLFLYYRGGVITTEECGHEFKYSKHF